MDYRNVLRTLRRRSSRPIQTRSGAVRRACTATLEGLESRQLFAITVATDFVQGQKSGIPVSDTDLINGLVPAPADTNYAGNNEGGPIANLTDGKTAAVAGSLDEFSAPQNAVFSLNVPQHGTTWFATYRLNLTASPAGYDISQVDSITGHQDNRTDQTIDIQVQFVGSNDFVSLSGGANFSYRPGLGNGAGKISITDDTGAALAKGVQAVRFVADQEAVYRELDVFGTPSTAPTSAPAAPTNLAATTQGSNVVLTFTDQSNNEAVFKIERAVVTNGVEGAFTTLASLPANNNPPPAGVGGQVTYTDASTVVGTTYRYRVTAFNSFGGGSTSAAVTTDATTPTSAPGFAARYFGRANWKGEPIATQIDPNVGDNNFGTGSPLASVPVDNFSAIYSAKLTPTVTGDYTFDINIDDRGFLFISGGGQDQTLVTAADLASGPGNTQGGITLTAGQTYTVIFLASEIGGGANFSLNWITPDGDGTVQPIPLSVLNSQIDPVTVKPTGVAVNAADPLDVRIGFADNSQNEAKYRLERATVVGGVTGAYSVVAEDMPNVTELVDFTSNPNTTYSYRVVAFNFEGSVTSDPITVTTPGRSEQTGATGAWYASGFWGLTGRPAQNGLGVFASPDYREEVTQVNFPDPSLNRTDQGIPADNYSTSFTGKIVIPEGQGGTYTFVSNTDDDGALFVNGQLVSYDPNGHGQRDATNVTPLTLQPGAYNFVFLQAEQGGGSGATMKWQGPASGDVLDVIPQENLIPISDVPTAPTAGTPDTATANTATITFVDTATSELRYEIDQSTDPNFATIQRTVQAPINASSVTVTGLTASTQYYFRVRAVNLEGSSPVLTTTVTTAGQGTAPTAPTNLTARPTTANLVTLNFTDNSNNEDSFIIFRRQGATGDFVQVGTVAADTTTFQDLITPSPTLGTPFTYRVVAHNSEGNSNPAEVTVNSGAPGGTGLAGEAFANTDFTDDPENPNDTVNFITSDSTFQRSFSLGPVVAGIPEDNFSVIYSGSIQAEKTEPYTFQVVADDQASLVITDASGQELVNLPLAAGTQTSDPINLVAGQRYNVEVRFVEFTGGASIFLNWQSPTTPLEPVPQVFLFPTAAPQPGGATDVYVRGSSWSPTFRTFLATQSGQNSNAGFKVTGFDASSQILSFSNLDTIAVKFSGNVPPSLAAGSVTITSAAGKTYTVQSVAADPTDPTLALIKLSTPIVNDRVRVQVAGVSGADGNPLDVRLNVLPADVNQSGGAVNAADLVLTRNRIGRTTANPGTGATAYSVFNDVNGDGLINASDLVLVRNNVGKSLPAAPALVFSGSRIAPVARDHDLLDELQ